MDLRHPRLVLATLSAAFLVVAGSLVALAVGAQHSGTAGQRPVHSRAAPTSLSSSRWRPVSPTTTLPPATPIQQRYDRAFKKGFSSPASRAQLAQMAALQLPRPAVADHWPALAPTSVASAWSRHFTAGLLDIDFARQSRSALGRWLVAEEAPDLMPGVPAAARLGALYTTVLYPAIASEPSPVPSAPQWRTDATANVRWSVSGLRAQPDGQWQDMLAAGWRPTDLYAAVEDVSGALTVTSGSDQTTRGFSLVLQLGSARWHAGYGTVLVSGWTER